MNQQSTTQRTMLSISFNASERGTVRMYRVFVIAAGLGAVCVAAYRAPDWLDKWDRAIALAAIAAALALLVLAIGVALQGSAVAVKRAACEISFLVCSLILAEAVLLSRSPESWSDDPRVQQEIAEARIARSQGLSYDSRLRAEVVFDLQARGWNALPGFYHGMATHPTIAAEVRNRGLLPLANVSNAYVVECKEGAGFLRFHSDELGFNNPPGVVSGPVDIAIFGESLALGHCVAPSKSVAGLVRSRYPKTATFGVAGARVLSQLGIFREYVEPLKPPLVVWFVNAGYAEPGMEDQVPVLRNYVDPTFTQDLRHRQVEVDSFVKEIFVPLNLKQGEEIRRGLDSASRLPLSRLIKLREIRSLVDFRPATQNFPASPNLVHFERALDLVADAAHEWGGALIVVVLPSYAISTEQPQNLARYSAVLDVLNRSPVSVVDGASLFEAERDFRGLYALGTNNHPNERGHALIAEALIEAIEREAAL